MTLSSLGCLKAEMRPTSEFTPILLRGQTATDESIHWPFPNVLRLALADCMEVGNLLQRAFAVYQASS